MKKTLVLSVSALLLLSSCGSYTGMGAYAGGSFGSIIGSAIGGIAGGHRGSDIGTLIGMAGGAAVGAAVGAAADQAQQRQYEEHVAARQQRAAARSQYDRGYQTDSDSGYDATNSGDDRLYGFDENFGSKVTEPTVPTATTTVLEIRNPKILDASRDGVLTRGEEARLVFEIYNISAKPAYRVMPSVAEVSGNKHIRVSENVMVESIMPGRGIRYTAMIKADDHLKDGDALFRIGVYVGNKEIVSQSQEFPIRTSKR